MRRIVIVLVALSLAGCVPRAVPMQGGSYTDPYQNCVANLKVLQGPVTMPYAVLGMVQDSAQVLVSQGQKTAIRNAIWDACHKWPGADAIVNFSGDSRGASVWYSGVVVMFTQPTHDDTPDTPTVLDASPPINSGTSSGYDPQARCHGYKDCD